MLPISSSPLLAFGQRHLFAIEITALLVVTVALIVALLYSRSPSCPPHAHLTRADRCRCDNGYYPEPPAWFGTHISCSGSLVSWEYFNRSYIPPQDFAPLTFRDWLNDVVWR